ncbi:MAG: thiamine phosphate synthase [Oscillospiraceae bacterium]|nr:thiamine phosphate synthase [Oscillospiraceae bacterium]
MNCSRESLRLYAITDRSWLNGRSLYSQVEEALKGGTTFVQLREKELDYESFLQEARELRKLCADYGVPFVINDNVDIAVAVDADGVHVGQEDMEAGDVRRRLGPDKIIGVSCKTAEQAKIAQAHGADYLGAGAMFPTGSKKDASSITMEALHEICSAVSIPVVAIGGISLSNVDQLRGSGIAGISVISALFAQEDIKAAAEKLNRKLTQVL